MKILKAEFARGIVGGDYSTEDKLPHVAFLGRSNSGKSSVVNSLTGKKNLVRSSKMPGLTIEANFFRINDAFYFADFPGYGFATRSISDRNRMVKRIFWYLEFSNVRPRAVFLIIDVANKVDKLPKTKRATKLLAIVEEARGIEVLEYSAKTNEGKEELFKKIESFL